MKSILIAIVMLAAILGMVIFANGLINGSLAAIVAEVICLAAYLACSYYLDGHRDEMIRDLDNCFRKD